MILSKSFKGKHLTDAVEDKMGWHGKPLGKDTDKVIAHLKSLIKNQAALEVANRVVHKVSPHPEPKGIVSNAIHESKPTYKKGELVANRNAFGAALKRMVAADKDHRLVILDADVKNSTFTQTAEEIHGCQLIEVFISEELLISLEIGLWARGKVPFGATFGTFLERGADQLRIGGITHASFNLCGSHCGITIGKDGPSHMAMEDISVMRNIPGSIVLYPSDAVAAEYAAEICVNHHGLSYMRCAREASAVLYDNDEEFQVGKCKVHQFHADAELTFVGGGVCFLEVVKAAQLLEQEDKIKTSIIDIFSVKPVDGEKIIEIANQSKKRVFVIEDNYRQGNVFCTFLPIIRVNSHV